MAVAASGLHHEMHMWARGVARGADITYHLAAFDVLAHVHCGLPYHVAVHSREAVLVVNHYAIPKAVGAPPRPDHPPGVRRVYRRARADGYVQAVVSGGEVLRNHAI